MKKDLPIYDIKLSDDTQGVGFISLVDEPAIGVDWIKLAKVTIKQEPKKVNSMMARKALGTLDGSGCFGCPPNGDGTKANGEPDLRCKGDGSGKGGSKGGARGGSKVSMNPAVSKIKDAKPSEKTGYKAWEDATVISSSDFSTIQDMSNDPSVKNRTESRTGTVVTTTRDYVIKDGSLFKSESVVRDESKSNNYAGTRYGSEIFRYSKSGDSVKILVNPGREKDFADFLNKMPKLFGGSTLLRDKSLFNKVMARKALGTLDGSGCFGCPPNGDGTRVNGEPDLRCKGDGSGRTGGGSKGGSGLKSISEKDIKDSLTKNGKVELTSEQQAQFDELRKPGGKFKEVIDKREMVRRGGVTVGVYTEKALMYPVSVNARDLYNGGNNERSSYPSGLRDEKVLYEKRVTQTNTAEGNNFVGSSYENPIARVQEIGGKTVYTPFAGKEDAFLKIFKN